VTQKKNGTNDADPDGAAGQSSVLASIKDYTARRKAAGQRTLRVLIVDDEESIRRFVERVLGDGGYETVTAADGVEAIQLATKAAPFDVLVTDVMMPNMTGDELARRLRQNDSALKVLYLTGYSDRLFKEKVTLWQDEAFLDKPCTMKGLREAVALLFYGQIEPPAAS
jgi:CheY-like chemotaxis protein